MPYDTKAGRWSDAERELLVRFFSANWSPTTLFFKIHALNSSRTPDAVGREIRRYREQGWEKSREVAMRKFRIGYLDIETTNLNATFGHMLTWYIKEKGHNRFDSAIITKKEIFDLEFDKRITIELLAALKKYDIVYTHYGADWRFDYPFIRTRALAHGIEDQLPKRGELFLRDTYPLAKKKLRLHSNRLDAIAEALNITDIKKTPLSGKTWQLARVGDPDALEYVAKHNKHDVILLERIHKKLECLEQPTLTSV